MSINNLLTVLLTNLYDNLKFSDNNIIQKIVRKIELLVVDAWLKIRVYLFG